MSVVYKLLIYSVIYKILVALHSHSTSGLTQSRSQYHVALYTCLLLLGPCAVHSMSCACILFHVYVSG